MCRRVNAVGSAGWFSATWSFLFVHRLFSCIVNVTGKFESFQLWSGFDDGVNILSWMKLRSFLKPRLQFFTCILVFITFSLCSDASALLWSSGCAAAGFFSFLSNTNEFSALRRFYVSASVKWSDSCTADGIFTSRYHSVQLISHLIWR